MDIGKVQSNELGKWYSSNPIEDLFYSQKEVARFLELGFLGLRDFPKLAAEIRHTAHEARTQHVLSAGLFKKFVVTASTVVHTYIPMMLDAVELQEKDIVVEAFGQVLEMCLDMKKETENTRDSYLKIQKKLQTDVGNVNIEHKEAELRKKKIEHDQKTEKARADETEKRQKELEQEEAELKNKVKKLTENQEEWLEKAAPPTGLREKAETVIDYVMIPTGALIAGPFGAAIGAVTLGFNIWKKKEQAAQAIQASREAQQQIDQTNEEKRKVAKDAWEKRKETLDKLAHIEALELDKSSIGDMTGLKKAVLELGNVDVLFLKIIKFWDSMAAMLKHLHQNQKAGEVYLKKIEDARFAGKFRASINKTEEHWNRVGLVCQSYVDVNEDVIFEVYRFLSDPIDHMTEEELEERRKKLVGAIREDADQLSKR